VAASLLAALGVTFTLNRDRRAQPSEGPLAYEASRSPAANAVRTQADAAWKSPSIQVLVADRAPVLIAGGPGEPVRLGARVAEAKSGGALHVCDWSRSRESRVVPGVEFWSNAHAAVTPDGKALVFADGTIIDLATGKRSGTIDLGGADYREGATTYGRIGDMRFAPDGRRLAIMVTLRNEDRTVREVVQTFEFPGGKRLCEFPPGEAYALRLAFSADGGRVAIADAQRHVTLRDATTGELVRTFEPPLKSQVMDVALSGDGKCVYAGARENGELLAFDVASGQLIWRAEPVDLGRDDNPATIELLRLSDDDKLLAVGTWGRLAVLDARTGELRGAVNHGRLPAAVHWSADARTISVVTAAAHADGDGRATVYPDVLRFDWGTGNAVDAP
jgi:outer membrane protein assembly factor BamB